MFLDYFGLIEEPFGVTPDPRFLHMGPKHREAFASLVHGTENNRGFLALIASPGMGKTSLLFHYLESLRNQARTAFLFHAARDSRDLLRYLLADLGLNPSGKDVPAMHDALHKLLESEMRAGRRLILAVDEAQNLDEKVLESVRVLSNFETPWAKLIQIVIAGQPQLAEMLARPSMAQLRQRISSIIQLEHFTPQETNAYIDHRLWVAGYAGPPIFTVGARLLIAQHSGGIPRNINNLCFHSMALASGLDKKQVDTLMVREVIGDLSLDSGCSLPPPAPGIPSDRESSAAVPFRALMANPRAAPAKVAASRRPGRLISATLVASTVLCLGLVSGASWKTDAGSFATATRPPQNAAGFPVTVPPSLPAPETNPSFETSAAVDLPATTTAPDPSTATAANAEPRVISVTAEQNTTLRHLSLRYLDRFDSVTVAAILDLNPEMRDPNLLQAGQQIRLPLYLRLKVSPQTPESGDSEREKSTKPLETQP